MTATQTLAEDEEVLRFLDRIARSVHKQYKQTSVDDLYQEAWLWVCDHTPTFTAKWADSKDYLWQSIRNHVAGYARKEKAALAGYETDDDYFYSVLQVRSLLNLVFTPDYVEKGQAYDKQPGSNGISDPSDIWAMVTDVRNAYLQLSQDDRDMLWRAYGEPGDPKVHVKVMAAEAGVTEKVQNQRIREVLIRLRRHIGGARPRDGQ